MTSSAVGRLPRPCPRKVSIAPPRPTATSAKVAPGQVRTIALRFKELTDTSVLVRVPVAKEEVRNRPVAPLKSGKSKNAVACEPPVSVLTEVAKLLEPGRCVT